MKNLQSLITKFDPITLSEMDNVKLMNRTDTKFTFQSEKLLDILLKMIDTYYVLDIDGKRIQDYRSLYYDTKDRKFYLDHHNQRVNRNKIRFREYVDSQLTFMEIKLKNNKGRTIKKRMKVPKIPLVLDDNHKKYIYDIIGERLNVLPQQWINFSRITFVHKTNKERLTIDKGLNFRDQDGVGDLKDIIIAEVKQERMSRSSDFIRIVKEMSILPMRLSKYCISTIQLNTEIKKNRFKKKQLFINKLKL